MFIGHLINRILIEYLTYRMKIFFPEAMFILDLRKIYLEWIFWMTSFWIFESISVFKLNQLTAVASINRIFTWMRF